MGISVWQMLILLVIVILLFGTRRIRSIGADLGGGLHEFRKAVKEVPDMHETGVDSGHAGVSRRETTAENISER